MKHKEVIAIMGKIVTVSRGLTRNIDAQGHSEWESVPTDEYTGWVCGITYKNNGDRIPYSEQDDYLSPPHDAVKWSTTSRTPCLLVKTWPTKNHEFVPLDGFVLGGKEPLSPAKINIEEFRSRVGEQKFKEHFNQFRGKNGRFV